MEGDEKEKVQAVEVWKHSEYQSQNYVLTYLDNSLYNVYYIMKTVNYLYESLDKKYKIEDVGMKKFTIGIFLGFKMVVSKPMIMQVQQLHVVLHDIHAEQLHVSDYFQVPLIIEKILPSWQDFKNYLKH